MPASTVVTKVMGALNTQLQAVAGVQAAGVYQGKKRFLEADNFETTIRSLTAETQCYIGIFFGQRRAQGQIKAGSFTVRGLVFISLPTDNTTTENAVYDLMESLCAAGQQEAAYYSLGTRPIACTYEKSEEDEVEDGIAVFDIEFEFSGSVIGGAM